MKYSAIVLLGGSSSRFHGDGTNKVYLEINKKPLFLYSVEAFLNDSDCEEVIVVYNKKDESIINKYVDNNKIITTLGGKERYESVVSGLKLARCTYVLVHDGARPFINQELISRVKEGLTKSRSVSLGIPVTDTIKKVEDGVVTTILRDNLYQMQTPQGSTRDDLVKVLSMIKKEDNITDDLMAFEKYSDINPLIVLGDKKNIKITTVEDYEYMKYLMEKKNV